jgi:hypothetical protein
MELFDMVSALMQVKKERDGKRNFERSFVGWIIQILMILTIFRIHCGAFDANKSINRKENNGRVIDDQGK